METKKEMTIDFDAIGSGVKDTLVPPGKYRMRAKTFERSIAKTGTHQLLCNLEILDKPEFEGCMKKEFIPLEEKSLWRVGQFINNLTDTTGRRVDVNSSDFDVLLDECLEKTLFIVYGKEEFHELEKNFSRRYLRDSGEREDPLPAKTKGK